MATTAWRKPENTEALGDGEITQWNQFSGGILADCLSATPAGFAELYWQSSSSTTLFSSTAYASQFGFSADSIGVNDSIDGVEIETTFASSSGSRPVGLRVLALTAAGLIEDGPNLADRSLSGSEVIRTYGGAVDPMIAGLTKAQVEATTFGVFWRTEADGTSGRRNRMKSLRVRVHYTVDGLLTNLNVTGLLTGSDVLITDDSITANGSDNNVLQRFSDVTGASVAYPYSTPPAAVTVSVYKAGYKPFFARGIVLDASGASIPVSQAADPAYEA